MSNVAEIASSLHARIADAKGLPVDALIDRRDEWEGSRDSPRPSIVGVDRSSVALLPIRSVAAELPRAAVRAGKLL